MSRVSIKELESLVELLNQKAGVPNKYQLQGAYGGWKLTKDGGGWEVTHSGFTTKSNLYREIQAYYNGYCAAGEKNEIN